ncbi:hypothetical protein CDIK_4327 [Cucumispora dikerogammari]|nr:hypothetical protein CDIK_4327 [Cucumispora dikerogammari]
MLTLITNFQTTFCAEAEFSLTTNQGEEKQKDLDYIASKIQKPASNYGCDIYPQTICFWIQLIISSDDLNLDIKLQTTNLVKCKEVFINGKKQKAHDQDSVVSFSTDPFRYGIESEAKVYTHDYPNIEKEFVTFVSISDNTPKQSFCRERMQGPLAQQVFIDDLAIDEKPGVVSLYKFIIKVQFTLKEESKKLPNVVVEYEYVSPVFGFTLGADKNLIFSAKDEFQTK